jgi:hypothetical protein
LGKNLREFRLGTSRNLRKKQEQLQESDRGGRQVRFVMFCSMLLKLPFQAFVVWPFSVVGVRINHDMLPRCGAW